MSDNSWKRTEREVMSYLGGERIPITGRARGSEPDGKHTWIVPEIKYRESVPGWLSDAYAQALAAHVQLNLDDPKARLPIVVIRPHRVAVQKSYVVLTLQDFRDWFVGEAA